MYIKVNENGDILGHSWEILEGYDIEIKETSLTDLSVTGMWSYKFKYLNDELIELTEKEKLSHPTRIENMKSQVRSIRDQKLTECDWIMLSDSQATDDCKIAFIVYRQELRDLLNQEGFDPFNVIWPDMPEYVKK